MRRVILLLFVLFVSITAFAQLEVKEGSFKEVVGFVNINTEIMDDDNNVLYAVIKVNTVNINDKQRHQLLFQGNAATFIELEYHVGEVWVYLSSKPATYLKISHPDFGSTEFWFPFDLKPKQGYEMVLVNKANTVISGWAALTVTTKPENGAKVLLNGRDVNAITPYSNNMIPSGKYEITVSKYRFATTTKTVDIQDGENKSVEIEMPFVYGKLIVNSEPSGAAIYIDGNDYGVTPAELKNVVVGSHELRLVKTGCVPVTKTIKLDETNKLTISEKLQTGREITISTDKNGDQIYVDGKYLGTSTMNATVSFGEHEVKAIRNGKEIKKTITVAQTSGTTSVRLAFSEGVIKGIFSVSASKKVKFSQGNLQYQASTKTWRFAEHQWDITGDANTSISSSYSGWIDLFGWGTSGYNGKNPWMTSTTNTDYVNGEMDIAGTNYDWGVNSTISNGGGKSWRTLTKDEWVYVFDKRSTSSGIRYAKATVNGVNGIILLPDNWSKNTYSLSNTNKSDASYSNNIISRTDWTNKFEANGAVLLPAAGDRIGTRVRYAGSCGDYWSASCKGKYTYTVWFTKEYLSLDGANDRYYARSVRLVCDVEE